MDPALASASAPVPVAFEDGFGTRRLAVDRARNETVEMLCLRGELTAVPSFEFALRERLGNLASFSHACYGRVRSVERLKDAASTLALVSDVTAGLRLSEMLRFAEAADVTLDIDAALCLLRQLVPAVAMLHENMPDIAHGGIAAERLIVTPGARLIVVEHVMGSALEQLRFSQERYWRELRVAVPRSAGLPHFDHRTDITQIGAVALSLILGRRLQDDETPAHIGDLVSSAWAVSARGGLEPLPAGLRGWMMCALQLDPRHSFESAIDAQDELERVLGESDYLAAPATLESFLDRYRAATESVKQASHDHASASHSPVSHSSVSPSPVISPSAASHSVVNHPAVNHPVVNHPVVSHPVVSQPPVSHSVVNPAPVREPAFGPSVVNPAPVREPAFSPSIVSQPIVNPPVVSHPVVNQAPVSQPVRVRPVVAHEPEPAVAYTSIATPAPATPVRPPSTTRIPVAAPPAVAAPHVHAPAPAPVVTPAPKREMFAAPLDTFASHHEAPQAPPRRPRWQLAAAAVVLIGIAGAGVAASRRFAAPQATKDGTLTMTSNPPGAKLFVDGVERGVTPLTVTLNAGAHALELRGDGAPRLMPITMTAGAQLQQYIELAKTAATFGQLQVRTEPAGAKVTIDGTPRGASPTTVAELTPGEHAVLLESDHGSVKQIVTIEAGITASLMVPLGAADGAPLSGWIAITAAADVQVFENHRLLGTSQSDRLMVSAGRHDLEIVNETLGYRTTQDRAGRTRQGDAAQGRLPERHDRAQRGALGRGLGRRRTRR